MQEEVCGQGLLLVNVKTRALSSYHTSEFIRYSTAHAEHKCESLITCESSALASQGQGVECEHSGTRTCEGASYYSTYSNGSVGVFCQGQAPQLGSARHCA